MSDVLYNENARHAARWLRDLSARNLITPGEVDERSIKALAAADVAGRTRVHFFAGVGGWDYALQLAGWPASRKVWTGSCPCQPFSYAGNRGGFEDPRDLWPAFLGLISECHPPTIFGEQVDGEPGKIWLDRLRADLEAIDYAVADVSINSASIGAPMVRQRIYWVADAAGPRRCGGAEVAQSQSAEPRRSGPHILPGPRPDHRGSSSTLTVSDVCAPSYGVPGRVGLLHGYGNAIDPEVAAEFVRAFMGAVGIVSESAREAGR